MAIINNKRAAVLLSAVSLFFSVSSGAFDVTPLPTTISLTYYDKEISGGSKSTVGYRMKLKSGSEIVTKYNEEPNTFKLYAEGAAYGQVFNYEKEVCSLAANDISYDHKNGEKSGEANLNVKLFGFKVVDKKYRYNRELPQPKDVWVKEQKFAQATFAVGPVPVTVKAGISLEIKPRLSSKLERESEDDSILDSYVHLQAGPEADLATTASAEAGVSNVLAAGVKNTLSIYNGALVADVAIYPKLEGMRAQLVHEKTGVHGKLEVYAELVFNTVSKVIATYGDSAIKRDVLLERTYGFNNSVPKGDIPTAIPATLNIEAPRITRTNLSNLSKTISSTSYVTIPVGVESARVVINTVGARFLDDADRSTYKGNSGHFNISVYNSSNNLVATLTSAVVGAEKSVNLPAGVYRVTQTTFEASTVYTGSEAKFYWSFPFDESTVTYATRPTTPTPTPVQTCTVLPCRHEP